MIKTNEHNVSFNDLTVDTAGLQALTHAGIKTATEIGVAAGAKMSVLNKILLPNLRFNKRPIMRNTVIYGHALLLILGYWSD